MKLTTLMLFLAFMQVSASTLAQKVTLSERNASLTTIFEQIRNQTGYDFAYTTTTIQAAKPVTIDVKNMELDDVLKMVFNSQPLEYEIDNKSISVSLKEASFVENLKEKAVKLLGLPGDIHGKVIDSLGQPLPGANISLNLKGASYTARTDNKGEFHFSNIPQDHYTLVVTYVGYDKLEKTVEINGKEISLTLVLHNSSSALDQVQVIAYGTESKRFSIGSVATVTSADIEKQPVTNPLLALEGQVAGLAVNATSGVPGSTVLVQVRGQNTLAANSSIIKPYDQPLFIIDGVPFAPQNNNVSQLSDLAFSTATGGISQGGGISPFNGINPNDIESITILKDADATSIYGTQGSNGVILITTKKGKPGKTTFNFNLNSQFNSDANPVQLLNTQQYLQVRKDAFAADGLTPSSSNPYDPGYAPDLTIFDQNKYTNWEKVIDGKTTNNTDLHASVSGGTANNTFLVSTGYTRSDYNYPGDFADQRYTLHSALHSNSADKRFTIDLVTDYGYDQNNSAGFGSGQDILLPPNLPNLVDPAGNLVWAYNGATFNQNLYASLKHITDLQNYNLNGSLYLSYKILPGLTFGANLGYSRNTTAENSEDPAAAQNPLYYYTSDAEFVNSAAQTINIEPQLNYSKSFGKGVFTALLGSTYKKNTSSFDQTDATGYASDYLLGSVAGASSVYDHVGSSIYKYSAGFARLKYIYDQKYIIEATGNRDGSSSFGPGRQFGNFGSVGAGWIFSEEKAFKDALPLFSYGKLSGSYGTTGTDGSSPYLFNPLYQYLSYVPNYQGISQAFPGNLYNPDYSWATKKSLNLALDLGLFNNRLLLNATYYRDREGDQLVDYPLPIQTGFPGVLENLNATIQNKGWEFTASSTNIKNKDFSWTTNFNLTFNRNKLLSYPNLTASTYSQKYIIGQPTSIIFGYKYKDVNPTTGLFEFYAANGTVTSDPKFGTAASGGDEVPIDNQEVNFMGGFGNNFTYKHFSLYIFCQFSSGEAPNYLYGLYSSYYPGTMNNQPTAILGNYWKNPGDHATLQRLGLGYSSNSFTSAEDFDQSSGVYSNDTYLRVKTVALSYALPDAFLKKVHIQGASIYVNAQNLFTITNYKVGDPEQPGNYIAFPLQRIVALGLNVKF